MSEKNEYIRWLENLTNEDVTSVGGKNASFGEMLESLQDPKADIRGGPSIQRNNHEYRR